jgi:hypothetical protein
LAEVSRLAGADDTRQPTGGRCEEALRREVTLELVADLVGEDPWALRALYGQPTTPAQRMAHVLEMGVLSGCLEGASGEVQELLS